MSGYGDCTYGGGTYGNLCGTTPTTQTVGSGLLGRRGPYDVQNAPVSRNTDDDDILVLTATF